MLGACGGDSLEWVGTVIDSAGVAIVSNPQEGTWTQSSRWTVVEDRRIGTTEGDPDYQFGQISGIGVASDGRIFVLDQQAAEVRVFSPDGLLENKFGRPGSGPGELGAQGAGPLLVGAGDTIFVPDLANQRVVRFSPAGEALGSEGLERLAVRFAEKPISERIEAITAAVRELELRDDLTLLGISDEAGRNS